MNDPIKQAKGRVSTSIPASLGKITQNESAPQAPVDRPAPGYSNDTPNNWLRGANEDATTMPGFDRGPSGYSKKGR